MLFATHDFDSGTLPFITSPHSRCMVWRYGFFESYSGFGSPFSRNGSWYSIFLISDCKKLKFDISDACRTSVIDFWYFLSMLFSHTFLFTFKVFHLLKTNFFIGIVHRNIKWNSLFPDCLFC